MRAFPAVLALAACASTAAEAPLTVALGLSRGDAVAALHEHQYCRPPGPQGLTEMYPRCERPGAEYGDSWVAAIYDHDQLVELRRWERYDDDARAVERWNQLVADREKLAPASDDAYRALRQKGVLQPGTRALKAFRIDATTIVGVYLLTPTPPENANVLEKLVSPP